MNLNISAARVLTETSGNYNLGIKGDRGQLPFIIVAPRYFNSIDMSAHTAKVKFELPSRFNQYLAANESLGTPVVGETTLTYTLAAADVNPNLWLEAGINIKLQYINYQGETEFYSSEICKEFYIGDSVRQPTTSPAPLTPSQYNEILALFNTWDSTHEFDSSKLTGILNVRSFGAVGDGVTDDTTAFQDALDAITDGQLLVIAGGTYLISAKLTALNKTFSIIPNNSIIKVTTTDLDYAFSFDTCNVNIKDLIIDCDNKGKGGIDFDTCTVKLDNVTVNNLKADEVDTVNRHAIHLLYCDNAIIHNCKLNGIGGSLTAPNKQYRAITLETCDNADIDNCVIDNVYQGLITAGVSECTFRNNYLNDVTDNGIYFLEDCGHILVNGNKFYNMTDEAIVIVGKKATIKNNEFREVAQKCIGIGDVADIEDLIIEGNTLENSTAAGKFLDFRTANGANAIRSLLMRGNIINGLVDLNTAAWLTLYEVTNLLIQGNVFNTICGQYEHIIRIVDTISNGIIEDNIMIGTAADHYSIREGMGSPEATTNSNIIIRNNKMNGLIIKHSGGVVLESGTTSGEHDSRPTTNIPLGWKYWDSTIGKPIFWNGSAWKLADGTGA